MGNQKHPLGFARLQYDIGNGRFQLATKSYAKIYCNMDFTLYPFDSQKCKFAMNVMKNMTYQEIHNYQLLKRI